MFPPQSNATLDIEALSGICGSISIACWVVVFSPQIIENFRRGSAEGLSIVFIVVWLLGDIFNILGAVLQGVLPTMIILAVYYTLADIVLLLQLFYYRGFTLTDDVKKPADTDDERRPLLSESSPRTGDQRRSSFGEDFRRQGHHLSPATPLHDVQRDPPAIANNKPTTTTQKVLFNLAAVLVVCAAGALGWYISAHHTHKHHHHHYHKHETEPSEPLEFDILGQVFGYLCAVFYLASRVPQILLNYRRKSTEGVSLLFFLFACIGNLTYDMSIFAYNPENSCQRGPGRCEPGEAGAIYARYIAVNASWIAGSLGTLLLDGAIFVQFFLYKKDEDDISSPTNVNGNGHAVPEQAISD
ncbi:putative vacuolar membrane transporter for cationic amino acids [Exophiala xenobiotica]|uniref:Vacuolar membrane transporter for cationic amino acids n=1 Tax=Lithohypha guttulata TaxID=1690604 RepID=A0ABR0KBK3_9EURO|nr:putative vacuolar membrane transporter for cationic amino acids [Lithohypha guttulata]KAK5329399.1 putative vacuolar membrane transporter for cationic amino acids [Exophiala xenobiotica]